MSGLFVDDSGLERQLVALPHQAVQIVVRFAPSARCGLDVHEAPTQRLLSRLSSTRTAAEAVAVIERAIDERLTIADRERTAARFIGEVARMLGEASVRAVAAELGMSERHLRRVFRESVGVSPKAFTRITRFHRAVRAACDDSRATWASIAAATGYYDQAHLIDEFRTISGVTPSVLLGELVVGQVDAAPAQPAAGFYRSRCNRR